MEYIIRILKLEENIPLYIIIIIGAYFYNRIVYDQRELNVNQKDIKRDLRDDISILRNQIKDDLNSIKSKMEANSDRIDSRLEKIENKIDSLTEKMYFMDNRINKLEAMVIYKVGNEVAENE